MLRTVSSRVPWLPIQDGPTEAAQHTALCPGGWEMCVLGGCQDPQECQGASCQIKKARWCFQCHDCHAHPSTRALSNPDLNLSLRPTLTGCSFCWPPPLSSITPALQSHSPSSAWHSPIHMQLYFCPENFTLVWINTWSAWQHGARGWGFGGAPGFARGCSVPKPSCLCAPSFFPFNWNKWDSHVKF